MPRKNKNTAKHRRYVKPDYHSQNKKQQNDDMSSSNKQNKKKNKLRTSYDVYKRLKHDPNIGIDLNYICIGYEDTEDMEEMPFLDWKMIDDGGDIPMHRISYFVLYLIDDERIIIWDKKTKLDRLFCSGETNKNTQSLRSCLFEIDHHNVPKSKPKAYNKYEKENKDDFDNNDEGKDDEKKELEIHHQSLPLNPTIVILDELISIFNRDYICNPYQITFSYNKQRVIQEPQLHTKVKKHEYKIIAAKTKEIMKNGYFKHPKTNKIINIKNDMEFSYNSSELYMEKYAFPYIDIDKHNLRKYGRMDIEIRHETTLDCAYRLSEEYGSNINMAMLNFSSAKNPGGGWDTGAIAQEESIARSSTLIPTLTKYQNEFYHYHRNEKKTMLYSHALIYSPDIVIMKHGNGVQIERDDGYYKCNIITSPAVNAGCYIKRAKPMDYMMAKYGGLDKIEKDEKIEENARKIAAWNVVENVMRERCKRVLELAMKYKNEYLILGAWGCGVFRNEPNMISTIFAQLLRDRYYNTFRKVVFAILDHKKKRTLDKFIYEFDKVFKNNNNNKNNINIINKCNVNGNNDNDDYNSNDQFGKKQFKDYNFV